MRVENVKKMTCKNLKINGFAAYRLPVHKDGN